MQIFTDIYTHFFPLTNEVSDRVRVVIFVVDIVCVFIGIENYAAASMRFMRVYLCVWLSFRMVFIESYTQGVIKQSSSSSRQIA